MDGIEFIFRYLSVGRVTPGVNMERSAALEIVQGAWQRLTSVITDIDDFADNLHRVAEHIKAEIDQVTPPGKRKDRLFLETESLPLRRSRRYVNHRCTSTCKDKLFIEVYV